MADGLSDRRSAAGEDTRRRLIETGERLIAERGLDGVSVREIAAVAGANSGSIHYHFDSREGLLRAILEYRSGPTRERRAQVAKELQATNPSIDDIAQNIVRPAFALGAEDDTSHYVAFVAALLEHGSLIPMVQEYYQDHFDVYAEVIQDLRPDLSRDTIVHRLSFALFLVFNATSRPDRGLPTWIDFNGGLPDHLEDQLAKFIASGLAAPE
jgi:AcrR family transcriptional regulator